MIKRKRVCLWYSFITDALYIWTVTIQIVFVFSNVYNYNNFFSFFFIFIYFIYFFFLGGGGGGLFVFLSEIEKSTKDRVVIWQRSLSIYDRTLPEQQ